MHACKISKPAWEKSNCRKRKKERQERKNADNSGQGILPATPSAVHITHPDQNKKVPQLFLRKPKYVKINYVL